MVWGEEAMSLEIREHVIIRPGGVVEIRRPELPAGAEADVVIVVEEAAPEIPPLASLVGKGSGCYATATEAELFLRTERDA
ncbi:MAG: hypothetical protein HYX75_00740 [Acidobacteria bacterium]|nr:hypothetical protein [Acidobacteriota bacterium]